jgi:hypothetical protein
MSITVSGVGVASAAPDIVEVDLGVSVLADTVATANETAAERGRAVISALTAGGIPESDMTTSGYTIQPEYDYSGSERRLIGYRVGNMVRANVRDVRRAGPIVDSVTAAGADHTKVDGIRFGIEDETTLQAEAREAAWNDAVAKATHLAALSGQRLGPATSIRETAKSPVAPVRMMADMAMAERAPTPIQPGTSAVTVTLEVVFALES